MKYRGWISDVMMALIIIVALILSFLYAYSIGTSDLPDWLKFYLLS